MARHRWEREKQPAGVCWYLVPIDDGGDPIAAIVPNDPESRLLRYRAGISFRGRGRTRHWDTAREAQHWVEQTLADWPEWKGCEIKKPFAFSERQRGIATTIIVGAALIGFAWALFVATVDRFWVPPTKAVAQVTPPSTPTAPQPKPADCRTFRPVYTGGWRSPYPPMNVWWQDSLNVVWINDNQ